MAIWVEYCNFFKVKFKIHTPPGKCEKHEVRKNFQKLHEKLLNNDKARS